jgi:dipeptidyl aminopeptidase/acylaminoacyl peptidase
MRKPWLVAVLLGSVVAAGSLAAAPAPAKSGLPPIIDRELLFGDPEISGAQLSPDGAFIAFMKPHKGTRNLWVKRTSEPFDKARPITADTKRPIPGYFWSQDGKFVLFVQDQGGDENYNVYAVDPAAPAAKDSDVPAARNITDAKGARAFLYHVPESDADTIYVGLNDRDKAWHDLYKVKISTGERTLLRKNDDRITGWDFDLTDKLRLASRTTESGDKEILRVDEDGFKKIAGCNVYETCGTVQFHKDGKRVYAVNNQGPGVDLVRLTLLDVATGQEEAVESDPEKRVDLSSPMFSDVTDELIGTTYVDDKPRYYWRDKAFESDYALLRKELPGREVAFGSSTKDERLYLVNTRSDVEPGETYLFDRNTKKLTLQFRVRETLPREHLAEMKPIRYPSSDGLEIPAYLTTPKGVPAKGLPLIALPHGGPWSRDIWGYNGLVQFLANRGYAVFQMNFRGSTGYGKKFLDAGNNEWGGKMQDDITWGVKYLVAQGVADPKRVAILGGSYGGYATLAGLAFTPDVYAAGVSIVGPSNLLTLLDSIPPYWEQIRKMFHMRMGDPTNAEGKARLERQSPLNSAAKIRSALLVIQGANDPRVKKAESDQIVVALRERGFPVEYIVAPDEGHGFARPVNNMAAYASTEAFLAKHLGGRAQTDMKAEVATRLKEITVDPKTVEMPKRVEVSSSAPKTSGALEAGTLSYKTKMQMGERAMDIKLQCEVKAEGDTWVMTETAETPLGLATDRTVLARDTLSLRSRSISQGPMNVDFTVKDGKIVGQMKMNDSSRPIDVPLEGDLFADGPGSHRMLSTLPIAEGYSTTFRSFDIRQQKVKATELKVVGSEAVTVPAGTFDAYTVELATPDDGSKSTVWVAKDPRKVVKSVTVAPQMGGATITSELE